MLRELELKPVYSSDEDNLLTDFYIPALSNAVNYDRAVGFFSAGMLSIAAQGVSSLVENGGSMRLIIGAALAEEESSAINHGYAHRELLERLELTINKTISDIADTLVRNRLEGLAWLISSGRLDVKVALREVGMFHDKIGVLTDKQGDSLVFQGSANETPYALLPDFNFESINVFESWRPEFRGHFDTHKNKFERLWNNKSPKTLVIEFPEACKQKLLEIAKESPYPKVNTERKLLQDRLRDNDDSDDSKTPTIPQLLGGREFLLFQHQTDALNKWKANDFNGVLKLATGAGKTITSIYGATKLFHTTGRLFLVITVPYQNLADQWVEELRAFGWAALGCYESISRWREPLEQTIARYRMGALNVACVVVVNRTLVSDEFQRAISKLPLKEVLFIGDECHHLSSDRILTCLPDSRYRLGLSATPEHEYSEERTQKLFSYFGHPVAEYSLENALNDGVLTPYEYQVVLCELGGEETEEYIELSKQIVRRLNLSGGSIEDSEDVGLKALLGKRARLLAQSEDKLKKLSEILSKSEPNPLTLFYCGDGMLESDELEFALRHVESVSSILHENGWKNSIFTAQETRRERKQILANFEAQIIESVSAIRCLDEGIDVPACRNAYFLASSKNSRQFVQRRGRILRRAPGKEVAKIVDFVITLPPGLEETYNFERNLFRGELKRIMEFARLSTTLPSVYESLKDTLKDYDLTHDFIGGTT